MNITVRNVGTRKQRVISIVGQGVKPEGAGDGGTMIAWGCLISHKKVKHGDVPFAFHQMGL